MEQVRGTLGHCIHGEYVFLANPHHQSHFIDSYDRQYYSCGPLFCVIILSVLIIMLIIDRIMIM